MKCKTNVIFGALYCVVRTEYLKLLRKLNLLYVEQFLNSKFLKKFNVLNINWTLEVKRYSS